MTDREFLQKKIIKMPVINTIVCIIIGWLLWNLLGIPYANVLVPMIADNRLPFIIIHLYLLLTFLIVGIFIGLISKVNIWVPLIGTFTAIFFNLAIIGKKNELVPLLINIKTFIDLIMIMVGGYMGKLLKEIIKKDEKM